VGRIRGRRDPEICRADKKEFDSYRKYSLVLGTPAATPEKVSGIYRPGIAFIKEIKGDKIRLRDCDLYLSSGAARL